MNTPIATSLLPRASQQLGALDSNIDDHDYSTYYAKLVKLASRSSSSNTKSASSLLTTSSSANSYNNFDTTPLTTSCYTNTDSLVDENDDFMSMLSAQAHSTHLNRRPSEHRRQILSSSNLSTFKTAPKSTNPSNNSHSNSGYQNESTRKFSNCSNSLKHNSPMTTSAQSEALLTSSWLQAQQANSHNYMNSNSANNNNNNNNNNNSKSKRENYCYFEQASDADAIFSQNTSYRKYAEKFHNSSPHSHNSPCTENNVFKIHNSNSASILLNEKKPPKLSSKKFSIDSSENQFGQRLSIELAGDNAPVSKSPPQDFVRKYSKEDISARSPHHLNNESASPNSILSKLSSLAVTMHKSNNNLMSNIATKTTQLFNRNRKCSQNADCNNSNNTLISVSSSSTSSSSPISNKSTHINFTPAATNSQSSVQSCTEIAQPKWNYDQAENYWYSNGNNVQFDINLAKVNCHSSSSRGNLAVRLDRIDIKNLTILELNYLKKICVGKLQLISESQLQLSIPKDESIKSIKQSHFTLRSKSVAFKLALYDDLKLKKNQTKDQQNLVFGQTIYKCILNDMCRKKSEKFLLSLKNIESCDLALSKRNNKRLYSKLNDDKLCKRNSVLFEALDLSSVDNQIELKHHVLKQTHVKEMNTSVNFKVDGYVPEIVKQCCMHIDKYGLQVVGIFRIDSSKKRIKEIRELFDRGHTVELDSKYNPLDVACLLKDYLRSLPEPLLTRKLYNAFIHCSKVKDNLKKLELMRYLICLLPVPNRDTLQMILKLLDNLKSNCFESTNKQKSGNKMDSFNLAMVFGPNILQKRKQLNNKEFAVDKNALVDDIEAVISVTKFLIDNQNFMFHIDNYLHNEVVKKVLENCPSELNSILMKKIMESIGVIVYDSENHIESGYSSVNTRSTTTTTDESSSSDLCQSSNELDKINSLKNSPRPFTATTRQEPIASTFSYQETSSDSCKENDRFYNFEQICASINAEARSRTTSTPPLVLQSSNSNTCLSMPYRSSSNLKKSTIKTYKQNSNMLSKATKPLAVNKNVYIKNRAYFPISHMNKNLINNLNEENNTIKRENKEKLSKTLNSQTSLLMIQTQKGEQANLSMKTKTKSLVNLNSFPYNESAVVVTSSSDLKKPANMDTIHFIGEQETLV